MNMKTITGTAAASIGLLALLSLAFTPGVSPNTAEAGAQSVQNSLEVPEGYETAVFAGGCFWCMEPPYDQLEGVTATLSGYAGGEEQNPTYGQVSSGRTGHTEVIRVTYDPEVISYETLLEVFWTNHDPLTADRQFCDWGRQYRPGVFYQGDQQRDAALASRRMWEESGRFDAPIVTEVTELDRFWPAEEYHQDFYKKDPERYYSYRTGCRRDARLEQLWGDS
jgi:peptide-methionine (S)-S-oxide reductase